MPTLRPKMVRVGWKAACTKKQRQLKLRAKGHRSSAV
jgi:hypothetical protein